VLAASTIEYGFLVVNKFPHCPGRQRLVAYQVLHSSGSTVGHQRIGTGLVDKDHYRDLGRLVYSLGEVVVAQMELPTF
jgi:hypothetical protein